MKVELTIQDRGFLRAIGAADAEVRFDATAAVVNDHLNKLEAAYATVAARAAHWKRVAFMWCSFSIIHGAGVTLFAIWRAAQ